MKNSVFQPKTVFCLINPVFQHEKHSFVMKNTGFHFSPIQLAIDIDSIDSIGYGTHLADFGKVIFVDAIADAVFSSSP